MAKGKTTAERLNDIVKENNERQAARAQKIKELEKQKAAAEAEHKKAEEKYNKAKADVDGVAMVKTKNEVNAAAEVVETFNELLKAEKARNDFTSDEIKARRKEYERLNDEIVDETNRAICELMAQIEAVINKAEGSTAALNAVINDINKGTTKTSSYTTGQLVSNLRRDIKHTRDHFAEYWPE